MGVGERDLLMGVMSIIFIVFPFFYRSQTCIHLQCFDASIYLQMNERQVHM